MKNPSKTSRRSFLKQSSLGVLGVANSALLVGLIAPAKAVPAPPTCTVWQERTFFSQSCGFATREEAIADAENSQVEANFGPLRDVKGNLKPPYFSPCVPLDVPQMIELPEDPQPVISEDGPNNFSYIYTYTQKKLLCVSCSKQKWKRACDQKWKVFVDYEGFRTEASGEE